MPLQVGIPHINSGKPGSEMDVHDLKTCHATGTTIQDTAMLLCRNQTEIYDKSKELGLRWSVAQRGRRQGASSLEHD
jgi:hypothetical protein